MDFYILNLMSTALGGPQCGMSSRLSRLESVLLGLGNLVLTVDV